MKYLLEVCVDSVESAISAKRAGANRLELCADLIIGGTTPSIKLFEEIRKYTDIKIHVLIRPRFGDFCYSKYECNIMEEEIKMFCEAGADGVVIGVLTPTGQLDIPQMKRLIKAAGDKSVTLHRAMDVCENPYVTLEQAIELGVHTVLTSGQKNHCINGTSVIKKLIEQARGRIDILVGAGVSAENVNALYEKTKATSYHMSGKKVVDSQMIYRKEDVNMGLSGFSEFEIYQTEEQAVRATCELLETI